MCHYPGRNWQKWAVFSLSRCEQDAALVFLSRFGVDCFILIANLPRRITWTGSRWAARKACGFYLPSSPVLSMAFHPPRCPGFETAESFPYPPPQDGQLPSLIGGDCLCLSLQAPSSSYLATVISLTSSLPLGSLLSKTRPPSIVCKTLKKLAQRVLP